MVNAIIQYILYDDGDSVKLTVHLYDFSVTPASDSRTTSGFRVQINMFSDCILW